MIKTWVSHWPASQAIQVNNPPSSAPPMMLSPQNSYPQKSRRIFWAILEKHGFEFCLGTNWKVELNCPWSEVNESDPTMIQTNIGASSVQNVELVAPVV